MSVPKPRFKAARFLSVGFAAADQIADNFIDLEKAFLEMQAVR